MRSSRALPAPFALGIDDRLMETVLALRQTDLLGQVRGRHHDGGE